jgi:hypothetical protein
LELNKFVKRGETLRKSAVFILIVCLLPVTTLAGCTTQNHRMLVTIKNTTNEVKTIEFYVDDELEISTSIDPKASVEREYELSQGNHVFELYLEVNGAFELTEKRDIPIESDSSEFFELT